MCHLLLLLNRDLQLSWHVSTPLHYDHQYLLLCISKNPQDLLDTAPIIYYIEATPAYADTVQAAFEAIDAGKFQALVSPVTLAECLILPIRKNQSTVVQLFTDLLTNTEGISMVEINSLIGQKAVELRVQYFKLPDALQIATAIHYVCDAFLTNDTDLKRVKELQIIVLEDLK